MPNQPGVFLNNLLKLTNASLCQHKERISWYYLEIYIIASPRNIVDRHRGCGSPAHPLQPAVCTKSQRRCAWLPSGITYYLSIYHTGFAPSLITLIFLLLLWRFDPDRDPCGSRSESTTLLTIQYYIHWWYSTIFTYWMIQYYIHLLYLQCVFTIYGLKLLL
jgi:hypothetical protein